MVDHRDSLGKVDLSGSSDVAGSQVAEAASLDADAIVDCRRKSFGRSFAEDALNSAVGAQNSAVDAQHLSSLTVSYLLE